MDDKRQQCKDMVGCWWKYDTHVPPGYPCDGSPKKRQCSRSRACPRTTRPTCFIVKLDFRIYSKNHFETNSESILETDCKKNIQTVRGTFFNPFSKQIKNRFQEPFLLCHIVRCASNSACLLWRAKFEFVGARANPLLSLVPKVLSLAGKV